jgi:hypothetical protein
MPLPTRKAEDLNPSHFRTADLISNQPASPTHSPSKS